MRLKVQNDQVPAGVYTAAFSGCEPSSHEIYGEGLRWNFTIERGKYRGRKICRTTKSSPTLRNSCGKLLAMLTGQSLVDEASIDVDDYVGESFSINVGEGENGSTRIEFFTRLVADDNETDAEVDLSNVPFA